MSSPTAAWSSNDYAILLGACSAVIASICAGARLSACVKISFCGENGWLYIERRLPSPKPQEPVAPARTMSSTDVSEDATMAV